MGNDGDGKSPDRCGNAGAYDTDTFEVRGGAKPAGAYDTVRRRLFNDICGSKALRCFRDRLYIGAGLACRYEPCSHPDGTCSDLYSAAWHILSVFDYVY